MIARMRTVAFSGIDVLGVDVQVQIAQGLPSFAIVGLPDKAVAESRERVRGALHAMGLSLPPKRLTVNLAPADLLKEGSHFDLPIALALLIAMEILPLEDMAGFTALGELGLDGGLTKVTGVLPAAVDANAHDQGLICPAACGAEAAWASGDMPILAPRDLLSLINHFKGTQLLPRPRPTVPAQEDSLLDLADVRGQETAKRALEITAAGGHNLLMSGPPGSGKSMLAARLPGILPPLSAAEALSVSTVHSVAGLLEEGRLITRRPFRDPHHSASQAALIGGGLRARPGEISLSHRGVLFLDELPEFQRPVLDALRQPLETGRAVVARANHHVTYPAEFQLIAAMNPCRCGYLGDPARSCTRAPRCGIDYRAKLSGPILDRIDLHIEVPAVMPGDLARTGPGETSAAVGQRVAAARAVQADRQGSVADAAAGGRAGLSGTTLLNARLDGALLERFAALSDEAKALLLQASERLGLSARGYHRVIRLGRTIADLEGADGIGRAHIAEALSYRPAG